MFNQSSVRFLQQLLLNNNREWFNLNKSEYTNAVLLPAQAFAAVITEKLSLMTNSIIHAKIFRINRDIRFSNDKTPYNSHVRIAFYTTNPTSSPSFYFSLEDNKIMVGAGLMAFDKTKLNNYQAAIINNKSGAELEHILTSLPIQYTVSGEKYKKIPCGMTIDFSRHELLKNKGIAAWHTEADIASINWNNLAEDCLAHYVQLLPLVNWLTQSVGD